MNIHAGHQMSGKSPIDLNMLKLTHQELLMLLEVYSSLQYALHVYFILFIQTLM